MNILLEELARLGMDVSGALERFVNNEALYIKFLMKFLNDTNMESLKACVEQKDYENGLKHAHTLKGVTGNLGLNTLYEPLTEMVAAYRQGNTDAVPEMFEAIFNNYEELCAVLEKHRAE